MRDYIRDGRMTKRVSDRKRLHGFNHIIESNILINGQKGSLENQLTEAPAPP